MTKISEARVAILATDGYERSELRVPLERLRARGAMVDAIAPKGEAIRSWVDDDWCDSVAVDRLLSEVSVDDYDALVLPGGQINPDVLRLEADAVALVREFAACGKTLAAICHGPWLLVEADVIRGREVASYASIRTDLVHAGADWRDCDVAVDRGIVTSRRPEDLPAFVARIVEEIEEGSHFRPAHNAAAFAVES